MGGGLAGHGEPGAAGQGAVCGKQQLRRVAHRPGQRHRDRPAPPGPGIRAVPVQPEREDERARGAPRVPWLRDGGHPLEPVLGAHPADVALAWLLANPAVTAPIIGPRTPEQLDGALRALELELEEGTMRRLDRIFPGPGGPAPEAYAW